eukprot:Rhum_TRINITY_DN4327_c0_g1::Rhum_TRINITY_DN4327_c0_g1_i1::g.13940::m.13940
MSLLAMPFLIINYGGEMIYILEQRLHSQQIKAEKAQKVLHDLTRALFNEAFISELLRPQALYSCEQTRDVCDKLAQSSIMKLSIDSMDKLFDLVVMGVKYQVMALRHPCELVEVTLNHIDYVAKLGKQSATTTEAIERGRTAFVTFAKNLRASEFAQVRHSLLDFSIRKRVKVSLFLAEKMQHHDGRFVLQPGGPLPNETNVTRPGSIRYADGTTEAFSYPLAAVVGPKLQGDPYNAETRDCELGLNFYTVDRKKADAAAADASAAAKPASSPPQARGDAGSTKHAAVAAAAVAAAAGGGGGNACSGGAAELNALGALLGVSEKPAMPCFRVSLFDEAQGGSSGHACSGGSKESTEVINIPRMAREDLERHNPELCRVMEGMDTGAHGANQEPDGLADLMDLAGM